MVNVINVHAIRDSNPGPVFSIPGFGIGIPTRNAINSNQQQLFDSD